MIDGRCHRLEMAFWQCGQRETFAVRRWCVRIVFFRIDIATNTDVQETIFTSIKKKKKKQKWHVRILNRWELLLCETAIFPTKWPSSFYSYYIFFACVLITRTWQLEISRHELPSNRGQETNPLAQVWVCVWGRSERSISSRDGTVIPTERDNNNPERKRKSSML
jgi:hypothetical protein